MKNPLVISCWNCQARMEKDEMGYGWTDRWYCLNQVDWSGSGVHKSIQGWACSLKCLSVYVDWLGNPRALVKE